MQATARGFSVEDRLDELLAEAQEARSSVERLMASRQSEPALRSGGSMPLLEAVAAISEDVKKELQKQARPPLTALANSGCATPHVCSEAAPNSSSRRPSHLSTTTTTQRPSSSREGRAAVRLARDLSEARAQIRELEHANAELRAALRRARSEVEASASLRADLEASRAKERELSEAMAVRTRELATLRHDKREAEAEQERLRTLLAAHAWFEHQM